MKIGELARATGTDVQTIRFYEREGLLDAPARTAGNYRIYGDEHVRRLAFIRHCRSLDMALPEIRVLLEFRDQPDRPCADVDALLDAHIGHVAERIEQLEALQRELRRLRARCRATQRAQACGILEGLAAPPASAAKRTAAASHVAGSHGRRRRLAP